MTASTLALGQASYELLEALGTPDGDDLETQRVVETVRADRRGGLIDGLDVGVRDGFAFGGGSGLGNILSLNVADASRGLLFNDSDTDSGAFNANLNILAQADEATLGLGGGDNRLNAARDLTNSEVQALGGDDTVRIGGRADGTFVSLGDGQDQLTVGRSSQGVDVDTGAGDDSALFLGTLTASGTAPRFQINQGSNLINLGDGNDKALFRGGIQGGSPGTGYEIQLGAGDDIVEFGRGSINSGFVLNTGVGSDNVILGLETTNAVIDLGWDGNGPDGVVPPAGDSVVLGAGALLQSSGIRSGQSDDTLRLAGRVIDTSLDLGWGDALVEVSGAVNMGSNGELGVWDLGDGNDTLVFKGTSDVSNGGSGGSINLGLGGDTLELLGTGFDIEFDLGDDLIRDEIFFGMDSAYTGLVISNFGLSDILWIGDGMYGYNYTFLNGEANADELGIFTDLNSIIWSQTDTSSSYYEEVTTEEYIDEEVITEEQTDEEVIIGNYDYLLDGPPTLEPTEPTSDYQSPDTYYPTT